MALNNSRREPGPLALLQLLVHRCLFDPGGKFRGWLVAQTSDGFDNLPSDQSDQDARVKQRENAIAKT